MQIHEQVKQLPTVSGSATLELPYTPVYRIKPSKGWVSLGLRELWQYRELMYFLTWRDIKVRYKQTILGAAWAILQPLLTMLIFSLFFGRLAKMPSDHIPYPLFAFAGLVPWTFFANGLSQASNSLVGSADLIKKVFFPRLAIPTASVIAGGVDFLLSFFVLLVMCAYYRIAPSSNFMWLPVFALLGFVTSLGTGLWLSALNVHFRDVRHVVPFFLQIWLFATPIAYPSSMISQPWRTVFGINPMVGVVEGFRWSLLGTHTRPGPMILVSTLIAIVTLVSGAYYFRRTEKHFADIV